MNQAGLPVTFTIEGVPRPLSPGAELTIYRVVQEALTNALKHAGAACTRVTLSYGEHTVEISILDQGQGSSGNPHAGHGLIGMRERVSIYGGSVQAGDLPEGGFAVRAVLPADEAGLMSGTS
jgi:signal transduction histidine kinase